MNYKISDYEKILKKVEEITLTKYESDYYDCPILLSALEDLLNEYNKLDEEFLEYKEEIKDNYKRIDVSEQYDINDDNFI